MEAGELGAIVDEYGDKRAERLAADKVAKALKSEEQKLVAIIVAACNEDDVHVVGGSRFSVKHDIKTKPVAKDWNSVEAWAIENGDLAIFQRRLMESHIKDLQDEGVTVPGLEDFDVDSLSVSGITLTKDK